MAKKAKKAGKKSSGGRKGDPMSFRFYSKDTLDMLRALSEADGRSMAGQLEQIIKIAFRRAKERPTVEFTAALKKFPKLK